MVGNKIILYKNPITYGSFPQPYFKNENARTTYLVSLDKMQANRDGVNINLLENYSFILKVNVDITICESYNFVEVIYNNKHYFADIMDYSQISLDRTKIMCKRNALYEVVDYFSYYNQFEINRCTINEAYSNNGRILLTDKPKYKYNFNSINMECNIDNESYNVKFVRCLLLEVAPYTQSPFYYGKNYDKTPFMSAYVLFPVDRGRYSYYDGENRIITKDCRFNEFSTFNNTIDKFSPYIISASVVNYPFCYLGTDIAGYNKYLLPFDAEFYFSKQGGTEEYPYYEYCGFSIYKQSQIVIDSFYSIKYRNSFDYNSFYKKINYYFDCDNIIEVNLMDYSFADYTSFTINLNIALDSSGINYYCEVIGELEGSYKYGKIDRYIISLNTSVGFIVSSSANFYAQNKYYQQMTQAQMYHRERIGEIDFNKSVNDALIATTAGAVNAGLGNWNNVVGNFSSAFSSISQGAHTIDRANEDIRYIEEERALNAKNEMNKPSESKGGGSGLVKTYFIKEPFSILCEQTSEFTHSLQRKLTLYGIECDLTIENININAFVKNGIAYIKGIAMRDQTKVLNTVQDQELRRILRDGCQYKIFS